MPDVPASDREVWKHPDPRFAAIDDAIDHDDYPAAQKLLAELRTDAKRTGDEFLLAESVHSGKEVARLAREFGKISRSLKDVEKGRPDRKAALAVGKYYCVVKGQWSRGISLLAEGDDPTLRALAAADSDGAIQPDDQLEIADRWWQYSQKVSDANERIAYQLRARHWMIMARPGTADKVRATIDQRLKQVPLFVDTIVVWNTHNGNSNDRGAEELLVSLIYQDKVVYKEVVGIPWLANKPAFVLLRPRHVRADQARVEITKHHERGGGLGEIEVFAGTTNIARHCPATADADLGPKDQHDPAALIDGDTSGNAGYWLTFDGNDGWAEIQFADFRRDR